MFSLNNTDKSWHHILQLAIARLDKNYLQKLEDKIWLPGKENIFNAFSLPHDKVKFILFGESPYPRANSANGYAFWDNNINKIFTKENGFAKELNRVTSLRNFFKMLLVARGDLKKDDCTQNAIRKIDKSLLIKTAPELFHNLLNHGFLLLNASLVFTNKKSVSSDAKMWRLFIDCILQSLAYRQDIILLLFGNIAKTIDLFQNSIFFKKKYAPHPYNLSFITNENMLNFFQKFNLLEITHN